MKLKTLLLSSLLLATIASADTNATKIEAIGYIKLLGGELKTQLLSNMKQGSQELDAVTFCTDNADKITKEINAKLPENASVRRASLQTRNPDNSADATDKKIMQEYIAQIESKSFNPKSPIKIVEDANSTRVYKPLLTKAVCLKCHGENVSDNISKFIKENYPKDQAMNFKENSLRGVIVAEIKK